MNTNSLIYNYHTLSPLYQEPSFQPNAPLYAFYIHPQSNSHQDAYASPFSFLQNYHFYPSPFAYQENAYYRISTKELGPEISNSNQNNQNLIRSSTDSQMVSIKVEENLQIPQIKVKEYGPVEITPRQEQKLKAQKSYEVSCEKRIKKVNTQAQYLPTRRNKEKPKKKVHLNENRNIVPNEINQIFSFMMKKKKSEHLTAKLMKKYPPQDDKFTINRFYLYQQSIKQKVGHYSTLNSLRLINQLYEPDCKIWQYNQQRYYNKLCRILVYHFLHEDSIFIILTSRKMKSQKKIDHLMVRRKIAEKIREILSQQH